MSGTLLLFQMEIDQYTLSTLFEVLVEIFWSISLIFIFCELGERVTDGFNELNDVICTLDWYTFPIKRQQMFQTILIAFQQPVIFQAFGSISCTRDVFKRVSSANKYFKSSSIYLQNIYSPVLGCQRCMFILYDASSIWKMNGNICLIAFQG